MASVTKSATTNSSVFNFLPKSTLHKKVVTAIVLLGPLFHLEIHNICQKNDADLRKYTLLQLSYIPSKPIPITHAMIIKLKLYSWSSEDIVDKLPSTVSLGCFVLMAKKSLAEIDKQLEVVTLDAQLHQPTAFCGPIDCTIH